MINLAHNENPYGPAPACLQALREVTSEDLLRYPPNFIEGRRSDLVSMLAGMCGVEADRVTLGYGAEQLLKDALGYFLRPGERLALPSMSWRYYSDLAEQVGAAVVNYPVIELDDEFVVDVDALLAMHQASPIRVLLIASPANPTGNLFPADRLDEVLAAFRESIVLFDEAYYGLGDVGPDMAAMPALTRRHPHLVVVRTFSKLYGLAGERIGYAVGGAGSLGFLRRCERYLGYHRVSEVLAVAALRSPDYYDELRATMAAERLFLTQTLPLIDIVVFRSQANFVLARLPLTMLQSAKRTLVEAGFAVKWMTDPGLFGCVRITIGTPEQNRALVRVLMSLPRIPDSPAALGELDWEGPGHGPAASRAASELPRRRDPR